jgi:hypothetical protein
MLTIDLERFTWKKPKSRRKGFAWVGTGDDRQLAPVPGAPFVDYRPDKGLFRTFAGLPETPEAVLKFANRFGPLTERPEGCPLEVWRQEIALLRQVVRLQDALDKGDWQKVRENLEPTTGRSREELVDKAAQRWTRLAVNALLHLEWESALKKGSVHIWLKHQDLREFMRCQFVYALIGRLEFKPCEVCGRSIQVDPRVSRGDRKTCSNTCRFQLYRQRKRKAVELHAKGWTARKIAKELNADVSKIKTWLSSEE